jgi:hypothetical protein
MFFIAVNIKLHCPESVDPDLGSVADPDPGSGSGMNILDHISESLETLLKYLNS